MASTVDIIINAQDNTSAAFSSVLSGFKKLAMVVSASLVAGGIALGKFTFDSVMAAARVDELRIVNAQLAKQNGMTEQSVIDAAQAIKSMGIETAVSEQIVAKFIREELDLANAADLARVAQDAAVISGQNSTETFDQMMHGILTLNPLVLRNAGLTIDSAEAYEDYAKILKKTADSLTTAEKQQALVNAVMEQGENIAGTYEAAMESASKQMRSWPRYLDDIKVSFGSLFQEEFSWAIFKISDFLKSMGKLATSFSEMREKGFGFFTSLRQALTDAFGKNVSDMVMGFVTKIRTVMDGLKTGDVSPLLIWVGNLFVGVTERIKEEVDKIDWQSLSQKMADKINAVDWSAAGRAFSQGIMNILSAGGTIVTEFNWGAVFDSVVQSVAEFIAGIFGSTFEQIRADMDDFWFRLGLGIVTFFNGLLGNVLSSIIPFVHNVISVFMLMGRGMLLPFLLLGSVGKGAIDKIKQAFEGIMKMIDKVILAIKKLVTAFANLVIPDWLTPGSPTPFELGLLGINDALLQVNHTVPNNGLFNNPNAAAPVLAGGGGGMGTTINITYAPGVSLASPEELQRYLLPTVLNGIRQARLNA